MLEKVTGALEPAAKAAEKLTDLLPRQFSAASVEDDPTLQERWAALLANAANPECNSEILPSFAEILKELTPPEVRFLDLAYMQVMQEFLELEEKMAREGEDWADATPSKPVPDDTMTDLNGVMIDNLEPSDCSGLFIHPPLW
jgi:hypothetical protein